MGAYTTHAWRKRRKRYLEANPTCACGAKATEPDHTPPRQLLVALGIHDPDADQWLTQRCASCHARKTRIIDSQLLQRWRQGEDAQALCEEAMQQAAGVG